MTSDSDSGKASGAGLLIILACGLLAVLAGGAIVGVLFFLKLEPDVAPGPAPGPMPAEHSNPLPAPEPKKPVVLEPSDLIAPPPRKVPGMDATDPIPFSSVNNLVDFAESIKGRWVRVPAHVDKVTVLGDSGIVDVIRDRPQLVSFHFVKGTWKPDLVKLDDEIEVVGRISTATHVFTTLYPTELLKRTPATSAPPIEIRANDLAKEFAADAQAATRKYRTKYLKVSGSVRLLAVREKPGGAIGLEGAANPKSNFPLRIVGYFEEDQKEKTAATSLGDSISFIGRVGNDPLKGSDIWIHHCRMAK